MHDIDHSKIEYLTVKEFACKVGLHYNTVLRSIKKGRLSAVRIGFGKKASFRIHVSELRRLVVKDLEELIGTLVDKKIREKIK